MAVTLEVGQDRRPRPVGVAVVQPGV